MADKLAKEEAGIQESNETLVEEITFGAVRKLTKDMIMKRWESMWRRSETGDWTRNLVGCNVGRKNTFPKFRCTGVSYIRALVNNGAVNDNMFRMGLAENSECRCGNSRETVEHILMECHLEDVGRRKLSESVKDLWFECKGIGGLQFDLNLILFPFNNNKLNETLSVSILKETFHFLAGLSKKL